MNKKVSKSQNKDSNMYILCCKWWK